MGLRLPVSGTLTQRFGIPASSVTSLEPAMWAAGDRAYWQWFPTSKFFYHFHPGLDISGPYGSSLVAAEAGTVVFAGWRDSASGNQIEVEIRPGTRYTVNHLSKILVKIGQHIVKGQQIGLVGTSGKTTGPHTHFGLTIREKGSDGIYRTILRNPEPFLDGHVSANAPAIQPLPSPTVRYASVKGPGINIRNTPDLDVGDTNRWGTSRQQGVGGWTLKSGIYLKTGTYYCPLYSKFAYLGDVVTDDGTFVKMRTGSGKVLYCFKTLVNIT